MIRKRGNNQYYYLFVLPVFSILIFLFFSESSLAAIVQCEYIPRDDSRNIIYFEGTDADHRPWVKEMEDAECNAKCSSEAPTGLKFRCGSVFGDPAGCNATYTTCGEVSNSILTFNCKFTPRRSDGSTLDNAWETLTPSDSECQNLCNGAAGKGLCSSWCGTIGSTLCCDDAQTTCEATTNVPPAPETYPFESVTPELEIPLPTLPSLSGFTDLTLQGEAGSRYFWVPWIGQYIAAIYKYVIGVVGILAGIMIVVGGLIWLTAGGAADRISTAKSFIESSLVGLVIALTSYLLLYAINPNLVGFEGLKIKYVERASFMGGGMEPDRDPSTYSPASTSSSPLPGAAEACGKVGELLNEGKIEIGNGRDRTNISSGTIPRGETCLWCYEDEEPYKLSAEACTAGGSQNPVPVNPKLCQLITALYDAGQQGLFSEKLKIGYIIGDHSRCTKKTFDPKCGECVAQARAGTTNHKYKSDHWDGNGMDIVKSSVPTLLVMQKYIVETLKNQLEIMDIFGPAGWSAEEAKCSTRFADRPAVSLSSPYNCNEGRCGQPTSNKTLCGHTTHIHVGF